MNTCSHKIQIKLKDKQDVFWYNSCSISKEMLGGNMKKLVCLLSLALILVGCSSTPKNEATPTPEATQTPSVDQGEEGTTGGETANLTELQKKIDAVLNSGKYELPGFMMADEATLGNLYYLTTEDVNDYAIFLPMMNVQATEIMVVEAKDGKVDAVKEALDKRLADLDATWAQYLPAQYELVQNYVTFTEGNNVVVVIAEDAQAIADDIQTALK